MSIFNNLQNAIINSAIADKATVNGIEVRCVYFGYTTTVDQETGAMLTTNDPKICIRLSDLPSGIEYFKQKDLVTVRHKNYYISDIQHDNEGMAELLLRAV